MFHRRAFRVRAGSFCLGIAFTAIAAITARANTGEELAVDAPVARTMQVVLGSNNGEGGIALRAECQKLKTYTDAAFNGGSYVGQGGFAESEIAAASYTLSAAAFPIRVDLMEMIFVTSGASVQTTTHWSVLVWDGYPNTGTLVAEYNSDGDLIPHLVVGPADDAVNLAVSIDPGETEQIYVTNISGTNTFSVGFRIDQHNNQTSDPCLTPPPSSSNAFPATDTSGLSTPAGNWLRGVNCGSLGCPPFGGWSTFGNLNVLCRPSGDWVLRVTYSELECQPATGACCLPDGSCQGALTQAACTSAGGTYQGDNSDCGSVNCPEPSGACCFEQTGGCLNMTISDCAAAGGIFGGGGTDCATHICFPVGACCLPDGSCQDNTTPEDCAALNGTFQGDETTCAGTTCPEPSGACCLSNGNCLVLTAADCGVVSGTWAGPGTDCSDVDQNGTADACEAGFNIGDLNCDGDVNLFDIDPFALALSTAQQAPPFADYLAAYPDCDPTLADIDENGTVNLFDIDPFVILLSR